MDKYKATWVSHSSISDFLKCPRAYYLRNVYKDPRTGNKMTITSAPLSLGAAVHEIVEGLSSLPVEERLSISLVKKFDSAWLKYTGKTGGFISHTQELEYRERGIAMLKNLEENPGPILRKAIKIKSSINLPNYPLSEEDSIILCGKIDWLEYIDDIDSVHIIDFKTGKNEENEESLQLPIYLLLAGNTQTKKIAKASYWYLETGKEPVGKALPNEKEAFDKVYEVARRIKLARQINHFKCPHGGCFACRPYEKLLKGEGEKIGVSETRQDIYFLSG
jgi:CRISPR/Cas system-associated exonuclease Cas4 (RecB family)